MDSFTCPECHALVNKGPGSAPGCPCCGYKQQTAKSPDSVFERDQQFWEDLIKRMEEDDGIQEILKQVEEIRKINEQTGPKYCHRCGLPFSYTVTTTDVKYPPETPYFYYATCKCHEWSPWRGIDIID